MSNDDVNISSNKKKFGVCIMSAGEGKRLKLDLPKPLAPAVGRCLVDFSLDAAFEFLSKMNGEEASSQQVSMITGHRREMLESYIVEHRKEKENIEFIFQSERLGTGDAIKRYFQHSKFVSDVDYIAIMCADTPLIRSSDLVLLAEEVQKHDLDAVLGTFDDPNPTGYGRIVRKNRDLNSIGLKVVEEKDASNEIKKITEVNSGLYIFKKSFAEKFIFNLKNNNNSGEFYLTDLFDFDNKVAALAFGDTKTANFELKSYQKFMGVNDLFQLELANRLLRKEKCAMLRGEGVHFIDSETNFIDWDVEIKPFARIEQHVSIYGKSKIESNAQIHNGSVIQNSVVEKNVEVLPYTILENSVVRAGAHVGPFARIRPESDIGPKSKIGNFVELKKSKLDSGVKISHLSYVGDAEIGEESNIGCGFITCNYDGEKKHKTKIGKNCFIGSDSQTIAPVEIGDGSYVASSSTVTHSVPEDTFVISRGKQISKEKMAHRFIKKKD